MGYINVVLMRLGSLLVCMGISLGCENVYVLSAYFVNVICINVALMRSGSLVVSMEIELGWDNVSALFTCFVNVMLGKC